SSRRRHTRFSRDWSSDVCSSDLLECNTRLQVATGVAAGTAEIGEVVDGAWGAGDSAQVPDTSDFPTQYCAPSAQHAVRQAQVLRSEERRVGIQAQALGE